MEYTLGAIQDIPDPRDYKMKAVLKDFAVPDSVDYEKRMSPVRNQYSRGACVAFATCAVKEYQEGRERKFKKDFDLSEEWIYGQIRVAGGGSYPRDAFKLITDQGVCIEKYLPYNSTISADSQETPFTATNLAKYNARFYRAQAYARLVSDEDMMMSLVANGPFLMGLMWRKGWFNSTHEFNGYPLLKRGDGSGVGGHAIAIVGYDKKARLFKLRNSWSESWGKNGYAYIEMDVVRESFMDAWSTFDIFNPKIAVDELPTQETPVMVDQPQIQSILVQKDFIVTNGKEGINVRLDKNNFELSNEDGNEQFVFMSHADNETIERWDRIADLIKHSTQLLKKEQLTA